MNCGFSPFDLHTSGEPNVLDAHGTSVKLGIYTPVRGPPEESASKAVLAWDTVSWCFLPSPAILPVASEILGIQGRAAILGVGAMLRKRLLL